QTFNLNASGSGTLTWYDQPSGGTALGTGASFTTPVVNSTTTFYVANEVSQPPGYVGPASYNFGTGGMHNNTSTQYLEFTVYQPCTLVAGDVNSGGTGTRTFTLWDSNGNQISQYPVNVTSGVQTVSLNIPLQPGSYRIGGTQMNLYRNNSGPAYPYNYNGIVSITGSSAGSGYYYYLYNWQIQPQPCASPRTPVVAYIGIPNMALNLPMDTVCQVDGPVTLSGGSPAGGTYSGTGVSNGVFDPTVSGTGTFTITYTYNDTVNGCSGSTTSVIDVETCAGISSAASGVTMAVFPNPATTALTVDLSFGQTEDFVEVSVVNTLGQQMYSTLLNNPGSSARVDINTEDWARGMYLLKVRTSSGTQVRKIETR
ncbi:MAG TPA: T9SS type A sorting domain-containing protein, partial [Bacteroidia bacterium]|nr:T9SS type A sorting domain-containing protein [Bacteroidia bacterium]